MTSTITTDTTTRRTPAARRSRRGAAIESVVLALAFAAAMGLAVLFTGVLSATLASQVPAGPGGLAIVVGATLGTFGLTVAVTRRAFLTVLGAF